MTAMCYFCSTSHTRVIPGQSQGDAVGTCLICHVLSCQGHGVRDQNYPRWICVACDTSLLANAGLKTSNLAAQDLKKIVGENVRLEGDAVAIDSLDNFFMGYPTEAGEKYKEEAASFASLLNREAGHAFVKPEIQAMFELWNSMPERGQTLFSCAVVMAGDLELTPSEVTPILSVFNVYQRAAYV